MAELKYLADHLQPEECRKLVAALHFKSYNEPNALEAAEVNVSEDIPCLRLLLHWNSSEDEGRGETHEMLFRRLRQIGRDDLAQWLGKTVFHELGQDLKKSLDAPFDEFVSTESSTTTTSTFSPVSRAEDNYEWLPFDTVCWVIILALCVTTVSILVHSIYVHCKKKQKGNTTPKRKYYKDYEQMETQTVISDSESEDKFDIRKNRENSKDDPALKLMGV